MADKLPLHVPVRVLANRGDEPLTRAIAWWLLGQGLTPGQAAEVMGYASREQAYREGALPRPVVQLARS